MKKLLAWLSPLLMIACSSSDADVVPETTPPHDDATTHRPDAEVTSVVDAEAVSDEVATPLVEAAAVVEAGQPERPDADAPPTSDAGGNQDGPFAAWSKLAKIIINDAELKEEQTDFALPVRLEAASFDYKSAGAAGQDLRFVDAAGNALKHQIDAWDPSGTSLVWLRLPKLTTAPTVVSLYYGNPNAMPPPPADGYAVWPASYSGVWHLSGDSKDATSHGFDGMTMMGGAYGSGKLARGLTLVGSKHEHIVLKNNINLLGGATGCTFSAWINPTNIEDSVNGFVIMTLGKWFTNNHNSYADFNVNAAGQMISHIDPGSNTAAGGYRRINSDSNIVKAGEWAWVTYVIDLGGSQERFFKNGQLASTKSGAFDASSFINMVSSRVVLGTEEDNIDHWYDGSMDEVRLEKGMRTPAWIAAQYRSMTVPSFVTLSAVR